MKSIFTMSNLLEKQVATRLKQSTYDFYVEEAKRQKRRLADLFRIVLEEYEEKKKNPLTKN